MWLENNRYTIFANLSKLALYRSSGWLVRPGVLLLYEYSSSSRTFHHHVPVALDNLFFRHHPRATCDTRRQQQVHRAGVTQPWWDAKTNRRTELQGGYFRGNAIQQSPFPHFPPAPNLPETLEGCQHRARGGAAGTQEGLGRRRTTARTPTMTMRTELIAPIVPETRPEQGEGEKERRGQSRPMASAEPEREMDAAVALLRPGRVPRPLLLLR